MDMGHGAWTWTWTWTMTWTWICAQPVPATRVRPSLLAARENIKLSRQNVVTIVKGSRESDFTERQLATSLTKQASPLT
eukprot:4617733-Prymnesium_polylepis.1